MHKIKTIENKNRGGAAIFVFDCLHKEERFIQETTTMSLVTLFMRSASESCNTTLPSMRTPNLPGKYRAGQMLKAIPDWRGMAFPLTRYGGSCPSRPIP